MNKWPSRDWKKPGVALAMGQESSNLPLASPPAPGSTWAPSVWRVLIPGAP